ncbi:hypothetical protein PROFUN_10712 [Planoprotostelium fungivorum]|uniref:Uncharacterized protein n=1 Tax=Planoprotostelium fungivorum TaxID=1890364 RepID=A0A2P6N9M8_9EUKA|nr:hypothetical protein PROFUN_10712 [Planoprotostelium fungivorum]
MVQTKKRQKRRGLSCISFCIFFVTVIHFWMRPFSAVETDRGWKMRERREEPIVLVEEITCSQREPQPVEDLLHLIEPFVNKNITIVTPAAEVVADHFMANHRHWALQPAKHPSSRLTFSPVHLWESDEAIVYRAIDAIQCPDSCQDRYWIYTEKKNAHGIGSYIHNGATNLLFGIIQDRTVLFLRGSSPYGNCSSNALHCYFLSTSCCLKRVSPLHERLRTDNERPRIVSDDRLILDWSRAYTSFPSLEEKSVLWYCSVFLRSETLLIDFDKYLEILRTHRDKTGTNKVFIMTDDPSVIDQLDHHRDFHFFHTKEKRHNGGVALMLAREQIKTDEGEILLSQIYAGTQKCDHFVGTMTSNVGRLAVELLSHRLKREDVYTSLDRDY